MTKKLFILALGVIPIAAFGAEPDHFSRIVAPQYDFESEINSYVSRVLGRCIESENPKLSAPGSLFGIKSCGNDRSVIDLYGCLAQAFDGLISTEIEQHFSTRGFEARRDELGADQAKAFETAWTLPRKEGRAKAFGLSVFKGAEGDALFLAESIDPVLLKVQGVEIGPDKLSHFFGHGFRAFWDTDFAPRYGERNPPLGLDGQVNQLQKPGGFKMGLADLVLGFGHGSVTRGEAGVAELATAEERGRMGLKINGVFSYADIVANLEGARFWKRVLDDKNPYVVCANNKWHLNPTAPFRLSEFVSDGFDEAVNCSVFRPDIKRVVESNIEAKVGLKYDQYCGSHVNKCADLVKRYGELSKQILNPHCFEAASRPGTVDHKSSPSVKDTVLGAPLGEGKSHGIR